MVSQVIIVGTGHEGCRRRTRMQSGAQPPIESTWYLGSVSEPRPPVGCSPGVRPSLQDLRRKLPSFVRSLPRYYGLIRLLIHVHARRAAIAFPSRPGTSPGTDETSQVPRKELLHVHKVSDCARFFPCKPFAMGRCCLLFKDRIVTFVDSIANSGHLDHGREPKATIALVRAFLDKGESPSRPPGTT
jgi:hypothetical protein